MSKIKKILPLFLISAFSFSQNIFIKYIGDSEDVINLTCQSSETLNNRIILNSHNRNLKTDNTTTILCNDISRNTLIYASPNETIEFNTDARGLINYYCNSNKYRKLESEFINDCYEKFGKTENILDNKELKQIRILSNKPKYFDAKYIKEQELLESYFKKDKISKEFYQYCISMYWSLIKYNELETKDINPKTFLSIEETFNEPGELLNVEEYRRLLENYIDKSIKKLNLKNNLNTKMEFISKKFTNQKSIDYLLYSYINNGLNDRTSKEIVDKQTIDLFRKNCKNQIYLDVINQDLQPKATPVILQNIIKKYTGKLVLLDFWASWCMPCREEFPSQKKLIQKYPNVAFVFLSIDKSSMSWQKAMAEYGDILNKENSLLLVKSDKDELLKKINLSTIPRYVLFDKTGKILDIDAPRPSSNEIETLIQKHM